jgi:hypothetical protein
MKETGTHIEYCYSEYGTYLCVVGLVWCKNHIDVKLIAKPSTPLMVATTQNMGIFNAGLFIYPQQRSRECKKPFSCFPTVNLHRTSVLVCNNLYEIQFDDKINKAAGRI